MATQALSLTDWVNAFRPSAAPSTWPLPRAKGSVAAPRKSVVDIDLGKLEPFNADWVDLL